MSPRTPAQNEQIREQKRMHIIGVALELFAQQGYHATSIDRIARQAGISKGLAYNYFASKEELVKAVLAEGYQRIFEAFDPDHDGVITRDELLIYINDVINGLYVNPLYWKFYFSLTLQPQVLREFVMPLYVQAQGFFRILEHYYQHQGRENPQAEAYLFAAALEGVAIGCLFQPDYPINEIRRIICQRFL